MTYGPDLAAVHHHGYGWAATGAAQVLLDELRRRHLTSGVVVDLGSGSGILARIVTDRGYDVLGLELSPDMIRIAEGEAPKARFIQGSVVDFEPPPCIAVTAIGEILNYRMDERVSLSTVEDVFARVFNALTPGGVFLFDLSGPGRGGPGGVKQEFRDEDGYAMHFRAEEDRKRKLLIRDQHLFVREGELYRRVDERHILHLIEPDRAVAMLKRAGFSVRQRVTYPGGPKLVGWRVFLAAKPKS